MLDHGPRFSPWKLHVQGLGSGHTLLTLKDDLELTFVGSVVADALLNKSANDHARAACMRETPPPRTARIYLTERHVGPLPLLEHILREIGVESLAQVAEQAFGLPDGRHVTVFNAAAVDWKPSGATGRIEEAAARGLVLVTSAQQIDGPRPDLALEAWRDPTELKKNGRWPYFCRFEVGTYSQVLGALGTRLSHRWWSMNEAAFSVLKEGRNARKQAKERGSSVA